MYSKNDDLHKMNISGVEQKINVPDLYVGKLIQLYSDVILKI